ncbi:hypothetical protein TIFTF001_010400 [Ficus carica]|uniref:Uncharacterized protein n=1 Tax=Ficus carica TaxID=3494 RepID=A0AA87ZY40_FICCA|nr:hypothetical protein TIFTF001_010400 [Ficus carica]
MKSTTKHVILVVLVLVSLLSMACCQRKLDVVVADHARLSPARHLEAVSEHEAQKPLDHVKDVDHDHADADRAAESSGDVDDDHHDQAASGDDYDFYRQYGDVPSPGIGH